MNDLIKERDERTERRKKYKKKVDSMFNLSYKDDERMALSVNIKKLSDERIRLLDEGAIVGDDYISFIIKKGTLQKFMEGRNQYLQNITDDFVGSVNLGHMDFATFPFIIGEWTKNDLSLIDIDDDGRKGIDVELRLDSESMFVKELERQPYDIGISSEFYYHVDWDSTDAIGYLVIDEVYIFAYGLVGECGNVNSSGLELKGESNMTKDKLAELKAEMETPETEEAELSAEVTEEETIEEEVITEETEEVSDEDIEESEPVEELSEEEPTEDAETAELSVSEEAEGEEGIEDAEEAESEEATYEDVEAFISELQEQVASLSAENAELKKTNNRLQKKLKAEKSKKDEFVSKFASVAKTLGVAEETHEQNKVSDYVYGDGIGE